MFCQANAATGKSAFIAFSASLRPLPRVYKNNEQQYGGKQLFVFFLQLDKTIKKIYILLCCSTCTDRTPEEATKRCRNNLQCASIKDLFLFKMFGLCATRWFLYWFKWAAEFICLVFRICFTEYGPLSLSWLTHLLH